MILSILRHGIAEPRGSRSDDSKRRLTPEGVRKTRAAARGLAAPGVEPELVLTSPFARAAETAAIAAKELGLSKCEVRSTHALEPGADLRRLFDELRGLGRGEVMCVGHAPGMDEIAAAALGCSRDAISIRKAGAAYLEMSSLRPPSGSLLWLCKPSMLRRLGSAG
jgi:phosphohistidine phosphatase